MDEQCRSRGKLQSVSLRRVALEANHRGAEVLVVPRSLAASRAVSELLGWPRIVPVIRHAPICRIADRPVRVRAPEAECPFLSQFPQRSCEAVLDQELRVIW